MEDEILGLVIDVAVIVTVVGLVTEPGAVYVAEAVNVSALYASLLKAPKLRGATVHVTPRLL